MLLDVVVLLALVGSALMAGLFWTFSMTVMPALAREPGPAAMVVMQRVNQVILRPQFLLVFVGTPVACVLVAVLALVAPGPATPWVLAGAVLHLTASLGLTAGYHVPRNVRLDAADAATEEGRAYWATYLRDWTRANHLRAAGCTLATAALALALAAG